LPPIRYGAPKIHGQLKMLGNEISERTVSRILGNLPRRPRQNWKTFLHNHLGQMVSIDFFTVPTMVLERAKAVTRYERCTAVEYARFADDLVILVDSHPRQQ
jgi:hypothetical protein